MSYPHRDFPAIVDTEEILRDSQDMRRTRQERRIISNAVLVSSDNNSSNKIATFTQSLLRYSLNGGEENVDLRNPILYASRDVCHFVGMDEAFDVS